VEFLLIVIIFLAGGLLGLTIYPLLRMIDLESTNQLLDAFGKMVVAPFSSLSRHFARKAALRKAQRGIAEDLAQKVDPREQQISDSAQTIRSILLTLAANMQKTDKAASDSSQTLGDVKTTIDNMDIPTNFTGIHDILLKEIDRVIASNNSLKAELASSRQILETQRAQIEDLRTAVRIDGLTQLANRTYFDEKLSEMVQLMKRYNESFCLLMIDVDNFKTINDSYGHAAGDRILKGVAFKIKETLRTTDFSARFGGDEFAIILIKASAKSAADVAWKLCSTLRESRFLLDGLQVNVTLSIGVAEADAADSEETLMKRADEALYRVKEVGRNSVMLADRPQGDRVTD